MVNARNEFTDVTRLRPEALGEPGTRTFRVLVDSGSSSAVIWLEKEQLFQLALAIQQVLTTLPGEEARSGMPPTEREAPGSTRLDFKVGKVVLGYDGSRGLFIIDAHDQQDEDEDFAMVRVWTNREQVRNFSEEAFRVCAAGRPLCPLCGRPLDPSGHQCARVNGHVKAAGP